jgi:hypothetical protein
MKIPTLASNPSIIRKTVLVLAATGLISISQLSLAAGTCKGLQQDACSSENSCSWIKSYTTKNGKTISAYCRNKSKPGSKKSVPDSSSAGKSDKQG